MLPPLSYNNTSGNITSRIESIDVLRGIVMVLMALDHCRDFFHIYAFDYAPEDLRYTTPVVFYTRWVTHFCAPVFVLLTGISTYLYQQKNNASPKEMARYLLIRGAILVLLEITIVRFAWRFYIDYSSISGLVLWAIGWSMILLAGLLYLPRKVLLFLSIVIIAGHNFLDPVELEGNRVTEFLWAFFHQQKLVMVTDHFGIYILYPVLPMTGIIGLGYCLGKWFTSEYSSEIRSGLLLYTGVILLSLFIGLRALQLITEQYSYLFYINTDDLSHSGKISVKNFFGFLTEHYGDPSPWSLQENLCYTLISFLNTTKYPMSLLYILMTLGPALICLSWLENRKNIFTRIMKIFGSVPLFYYILHLFLIHGLALLIAIFSHLDKIQYILNGDWQSLSQNYGFHMPIVFLMWIFVLIQLYPACLVYRRLKYSGRYPFLSYL